MSEYWSDFFAGPFAISDANASTLNSLDQKHEFVAVTGNQVEDTGVREYTTETRNGVKGSPHVSSNYSLLLVGDHAGLVVKGDSSLTAVGQLKPLPTEIPALIFPDEKDARLRSRLYPVLLDTGDSYRAGGYVMIGGLALYALLIWIFGRRAWGYVKDISRHPVVRRVETWSDAVEATALCEQEMTTPRFKRSGLILTKTFVIDEGLFSFNLLAWNHLLWAYRKQTTRRLYGIIPTSRSQEAILHFYGGSVSFNATKKKVEEVLLFAADRAPWAILGYSDELNRLWTKESADFTAGVDARKSQYFAQAS